MDNDVKNSYKKKRISFIFVLKYTLLTFFFGVTVSLAYSAEMEAWPGEGTPENPYRISKPQDFTKLAEKIDDGEKYAGKFFVQTQNINLSGIEGWMPIGTRTNHFQGTFDGADRLVRGLVVSADTEICGLFGYIGRKGMVKSLHLVSADVKGYNAVGGIAGVNDGTIKACSISGHIEGSGDFLRLAKRVVRSKAKPFPVGFGLGGTGGIAGLNAGTVSECFSMSRVTSGWGDAGGIVGANSGLVEHSYFSGSVLSESFVGGIAGSNAGILRTNYASGSIFGRWGLGGIMGENGTSFFSNAHAENCFFDVQATGRMGGSPGGKKDGTMIGMIPSDVGWMDRQKFEESKWFTTINSYPQLRIMAESDNDDLRSMSALSAVPILFADGDGANRIRYSFGLPERTILDEEISWSCDDSGVVISPSLDGESFRRVTLKPGLRGLIDLRAALPFGATRSLTLNVDTTAFPGGGTMTNPYRLASPSHLAGLAADVNTGNDYAGRFFVLSDDIDLLSYPDWIPIGVREKTPFQGRVDGAHKIISNLVVSKAEEVNNIGLFGFIGKEGTVTGLHLVSVDIDVPGPAFVGGIAGANLGLVAECSVSGALSSREGGSVGGLLGINNGSVVFSYTVCDVGGEEMLGGLVGRNAGNIAFCYSVGSVSGDKEVGGLVGKNAGTLNDSYAAGRVWGIHSVGGAVGLAREGEMSNVFFDVAGAGLSMGVGNGIDKTTGLDLERTSSDIFPVSAWHTEPGHYPQLRIFFESPLAGVRDASARSVVPKK